VLEAAGVSSRSVVIEFQFWRVVNEQWLGDLTVDRLGRA
jgi:hypothetical protein